MSKVLEIMAFSNWIDIFNKITSVKKFQVLYLFHFKCFEQNNKKNRNSNNGQGSDQDDEHGAKSMIIQVHSPLFQWYMNYQSY